MFGDSILTLWRIGERTENLPSNRCPRSIAGVTMSAAAVSRGRALRRHDKNSKRSRYRCGILPWMQPVGLKQQQTHDPDLEHRATERTHRLLGFAANHFGVEIARPDVRFDLRGRAAGQVRRLDRRACVVRYNTELLVRYPSEFLAQTVPHEAAHIVVIHLHGPRHRPHGREWQAAMRLFDARPERCHHFDVADMPTRRLREYDYRCTCRAHRLSSIRHNRIQAGLVYLCRYCGHPLRLARGGPTESDTHSSKGYEA
jgi:SprT protein